MMLKRTLSEREADRFKQRVISDLLPSGRLTDLDLELQIWHTLSDHPECLSHFGVLGEPGPDFIVTDKNLDYEVEGKCISPETGMPLSYGLISSLMKAIGGRLTGRYPGQFVTIEVEVSSTHPTSHAIPAFKAQIEQTYETAQNTITQELTTKINFRSLDEVISSVQSKTTPQKCLESTDGNTVILAFLRAIQGSVFS